MAEKGSRALVAGNWKMNGTSASMTEVRLLVEMLKGVELGCDVMICPPATLLSTLHKMLGTTKIQLGAQDCHSESHGPFTGDISAEMIRDSGAAAVIVGHSERRIGYGESSAMVRAKAGAAHRAGLRAIICIGETKDEREAGETLPVLSRQLRESLPPDVGSASTVIAYEPVWAIGTGFTPTISQITEAHAHIRHELIQITGRAADRIGILYGGSVKPGNATEITAVDHVDGALVGGASLKAADFIGIIKAYTGPNSR
jgi:triosephosphate isomerase